MTDKVLEYSIWRPTSFSIRWCRGAVDKVTTAWGGESPGSSWRVGCGKSVTALSILRLISRRRGRSWAEKSCLTGRICLN